MTTAARIDAVERGLNGTARRVLQAVPIQESWSTTQIISELGRLGAAVPNKATIEWALKNLLDHKLIRQTAVNMWVRVPARPRLTAVLFTPKEDAMPAKPVQSAPMPLTEHPMTPMDKLGSVSSTLRKLSAQLANLAEDLDNVAVEIETSKQSTNAEHEKLKQLAAVLKSLTQ